MQKGEGIYFYTEILGT